MHLLLPTRAFLNEESSGMTSSNHLRSMKLPPFLNLPINPASITGQIPPSDLWSPHTLRVVAKVFLPVLLVPLAVLYLVNKLRNWGWWRLHKQTSNSELEVYVRVWHGWIEREKHYRHTQKPKKVKQYIARKLAWKTTTADYSWVFWDPDGIEQQAFRDGRDRTIIRHLPAWMRSYRHGKVGWNDKIHDPGKGRTSKRQIHKSYDIESGRVSANSKNLRPAIDLPNQTDENYSGDVDQVSTVMMSGALLDARDEDATSTLRRRRILDGRPSIWRMGSIETDRAALCQLISPNLEVQTSSPDSGTARRAESFSEFQLGPILSRTGSQLVSLPEQKSSELFPIKNPNGPMAPANSPKHLALPSGNYRNLSDHLDASNPLYDNKFAKSLDRRLEEWERLRSASPYMRSIGRPDCGIAGRSGTPVTEFASLLVPSSDEYTDLNTYEAEGSIDGAISSYGSSAASVGDNQSSAVTGHHPWYRRTSIACSEGWKSSPGPLNLSQTGQGQFPYTSCSSPRVMSSSYVPHISFIKPLKRRRLVDRGIHVSPPCEQEDLPQDDPTESVPSDGLFGHTPFPLIKRNAISDSENGTEKRFTRVEGVNKDALEHPCNKGLKEANEKKDGPLPFACTVHTPSDHHIQSPTTLLEFQFTHDLQNRLDRLLYELSPGFRGPKGNLDRLYWGCSPIFLSNFAGDVPSRATQATIKRLTYPQARLRRSFSSPTRSSPPHTPDVRSVDGRRTATADELQGSKGETIMRADPYPNAKFSEPDEGAIDVLAWLLRRPPQGFPHDDQAPSTLYTGVFGKVRTRAEWESLPSCRKSMVSRLKSVGNLLTGRRGIRSDENGEGAFEGDTLAENSEKTLVDGVGGEGRTG